MAVLALGVAGAALGGSVGFASLGWVVGTTLGRFLFPEKGASVVQEGPRVNDLRVQASTWGAAIPIPFGDFRCAGNIIWTSGIRETRHETSQSSGGRGKGGGGGGGATTVTQISYTYDVDLAIGIAQGEITGVRRIWANGRLIYDVGASADVATIIASNSAASGFLFYTGSETQLPDATMEAALGSGNVPAHRGLAYVMLRGFQLADFGNSIPNFTFEAIAAGTLAVLAVPTTWSGSLAGSAVRDARWNGAGAIFAHGSSIGNLSRWSPLTGELIGTNDYNATGIRGLTCSSFDFAALCPGVAGQMFASAFASLSGNSLSFIQRMDEHGTPLEIWWAGPGFGFTLGSKQLAFDSEAWIYFGSTAGNVYAINTVTADELDDPSAPVTTDRIQIGGGGVGGITTPVGPFTQSGTRVALLATLGTDYRVCFPAGAALNAWTLGPGITTSTSVNTTNAVVFDHLGNPWVAWEVATPATHGEVHQIDPADGSSVRSIVLENGSLASTCTRFFFSTDGYLYTYGGSVWTKRDYLDGTVLETSATVTNVSNEFPTPWANILQISDGGNTQVALKILEPIPRITVTASTTLDDVVTDLCGLAGLAPADIDVSELTDTVDGYMVARIGTARAAIEPLQKVYFFDAVESDTVLKFVKRGGSSLATIDFDDLAPGEGGGDPLELVRMQEQELPRQITVNFLNKDGDYLQGTEYARRLVTESDSDVVEDLPIALAPAHAAQVAESLLYDTYTQRNRFKFSTSRKFAKYEPTDVLTVEGVDASYDIHIRRKTDRGPRIDWEGVAADAPVYTSEAVGATDQEQAPGVAFPGPTRLELLDIPIIRDADDDAGFYAALSGYTDTWRGGVLMGSPDGVQYAELGSVLNSAVVGIADTALGTWTGGNFYDEKNTVTVTLDSGELESITSDELMLGGNAALLGDELIQFRSASLVSGTTYTLSGLLRGRRGTESAYATHSIGERFVLLQLAGVLRPVLATSDINVDRRYKAVSFGESAGTAIERTFRNTGAGLKPYAGVHLAAHRHQPATNDWTVTWLRRGRLSAGWLSAIEVPLGEATESYEVDIVNISTGAIVRTLTASSESVTYTEAQQTSDFGFAQTTIKARIYQLSATVGRGFPAERTF